MTTTADTALDLQQIQQAQQRIAQWIVQTPLVHCEELSAQYGLKLGCKAENLQYVGAFKARGASNAVLQLDFDSARRGVVTHSSGNHAAALARAASKRDIPAHIVMPHNSAKKKIQAVRNFGFEPYFCEPSAPERAAAAAKVQDETGAVMVHPYDDAHVMAGQGTVGLEILQQWSSVDIVVVPVGGGGLLSGMLVAIKSLKPRVQIYAAEPEWADDAARSLAAGTIQMPTRYDSIADGLRTSLGQLTFPIIQQYLDGIVCVSESEILTATRQLAMSARLVAEPSGAVSLAAAIKMAPCWLGKNVCVVVSGGNLDLSILSSQV
jgi:threonine dehydratase